MSRAEGYSLDLYCDGPGPHPYRYFPHQYGGHTQAEVYRAAREDGWLLARWQCGTRHDLCPICSKKKPRSKAGPV